MRKEGNVPSPLNPLECNWPKPRRLKTQLCRQKRHPLTKNNLMVSKDNERQCLACWWEKKLDFIEAFNRSKANGVTTASVAQLVKWSKKADQVAKIAEAAKDAATLLARQQDLRLFWATRKFQEAQKRFDRIVQIAQEISEASKLKRPPAKNRGSLNRGDR
jgi:hypothetical protein